MADIQRMACPDCGQMNAMVGVVNQVRQYVCQKCGQMYYTPDSCIGAKKDAAPKAKKDCA